ncbi:MAG TPA: PIG-L family deacetylase [Acidimicrobiales bacterium]|nr:PIG-L family deacetylase [Acidimicrobiales bacterium]
MTYTAVFFHAHPDDEALYTGGTMARLAGEGHRVVLVTATLGEAGLSSADASRAAPLGAVRQSELEMSASALGCARMVLLGLGDSGMNGSTAGGFARCDPRDPAARLAAVLRDEEADVLVTYDSNGGYGHPDHLQVHRVGTIAAEVARTRLELYATVDRDLLKRALTVAGWARRTPEQFRSQRVENTYAARTEITHRVDVRDYLPQKRAALEAHCSQAVGGQSQRTLSWLLSLPDPLFRIVLGREWFIEAGRTPGRRKIGDPLLSLRQGGRSGITVHADVRR